MLLLLGSAVPQSEKVAAAVEAMILRRMQGQVAAAKKDATGARPGCTPPWPQHRAARAAPLRAAAARAALPTARR